MYTQCPECEIAFRVTADVLKQAAGMVRCGGCSHAFNALAFLSETMPKQSAAVSARTSVPELKPEIIETDSKPPKSISAEQSAALLKTLDELAGSNIRIEDTGVEWRVLDEDEASEPAADDDFADVDNEEIDKDKVFEQTSVDELRFDDNTPLPDDFDLDDQPLPTAHAEPVKDAKPDEPVFTPIEPQAEFALTEPDEWTDLLGEFQELADDVAAPVDDVADEVEAPTESADDHEAPLDMDTQFALQAEAMGIDVTGAHAVDDDIAEALEQDLEEERAEDREDAQEEQLEAELEDLADEPDEDDEPVEFSDELEAELEEDLEDALDDEIEDALEEALEDELDEKLEDEILEDDDEELNVDDDDIAQLDMIEEQFEPVIASHTIEDELALLEAESQADDDGDEDDDQHVVPPMTEEEHTVNMQIDQDLMALAIEDEDGFASTIIIPDGKIEKKATEGKEKDDFEDFDFGGDDTPPGFETIIMEGDDVRSALDSEKREADAAAAAALAELAAVDEAQKAQQSGGNRYGMIGGVVLLVLVLGFQMMHQSREALATIPAFSSTVGQFYRAIGQPVQPAWDITAWRIEASEDTIAADEGTENLTVYSRIGNTSDRAMPYPLISISLTDRYLEPVGSQILDPADYLTSDLDPRKHVEPGNTFNAVMSIQSPSIEATGYKLDVCYRLSDGRLRCAIDDFK